MKNFRIVLIIVFLLVLFILSVSLLAAGSTQFNRQTLSYNLVPLNCTLTTTRVLLPCGGDSSTWLGVWNNNIVDDIFSIYPFQANSPYNQNVTYPCLCDPNRPQVISNCEKDIWRACYLNIEATRYVQMTGMVFKYGSDVMLAIGSLLLVFLVIFGIAMYRNRKDVMDYTLGAE